VILWAEHGWCMRLGSAVELIAHTGREGGSIPPLSRPSPTPAPKSCGVGR